MLKSKGRRRRFRGAARELGVEARRHLPRIGEVAPGGHARDADAHPPGATEGIAQVAGLDERHGVRERRDRKGLAERHALAERVDGPAIDRCGNADGPAGLLPRQRPQPSSQAGRRARQDLQAEDGPQVRAGGRWPGESRAGRLAGQAPPEGAAGAGSRPGVRSTMRAACRNRRESDFGQSEFRNAGRGEGARERLTSLEGIGYARVDAASASRFQHRSGHSQAESRET